MKPQRVYPLTVEVPRGSAGRLLPAGAGDAVVVRPLIPGAVVVPAEQRLDVARPGSKVSFSVTPLAKGRLPNPRVEVLQHGRVVQEIGLRMKGVTQRMTWWLLALTILVPSLLLYYGREEYHALSGEIPHKSTVPPRENGNPGAADANKNAKPADPAKTPVDSRRGGNQAPKDDKAAEPGPGAKQPGDGDKPAPKEGKEPAGQQPGPGDGPMGGPPGGPQPPPLKPLDPRQVDTYVKGSSGEVLAYKIDGLLNKDVPKVPYVNEEPKLPLSRIGADDAAAGAAVSKYLGKGYDLYIAMADSHISFWIGVFLLMLTFLSWLTHTTGRTSRRSSVELVPAPAGGHAQETLPLGPSGPPPLSVEPA
jgi:hypothetical protein